MLAGLVPVRLVAIQTALVPQAANVKAVVVPSLVLNLTAVASSVLALPASRLVTQVVPVLVVMVYVVKERQTPLVLKIVRLLLQQFPALVNAIKSCVITSFNQVIKLVVVTKVDLVLSTGPMIPLVILVSGLITVSTPTNVASLV